MVEVGSVKSSIGIACGFSRGVRAEFLEVSLDILYLAYGYFLSSVGPATSSLTTLTNMTIAIK